MRIGIVPGLNASDGGIYQYSVTMLQALEERRSHASGDEFIIFASDMRNPTLGELTEKGWNIAHLVPPTLKRRSVKLVERIVGPRPREAMFRLAGRLFHRNTITPSDLDSVCFNQEMDRWFRRNGIELMLYAISSSLSFETGIPYVMAVHDLQHRLQPQFPEVSANGEWESREYLFRNGIRNATLLLAESETGKEDILNFYGHYSVTPDRIKVLPLLPSSMLAEEVSPEEQHRVRAAYELPERYMFYPAQFWPHKNHLRIVEALGSLKKKRGLEIPILFCGFHSGEVREQVFAEVMSRAAKLGIDKQIKYLGYVPDQDMAALYKGARALIMPTFFGATNIPPLEAWSLGCPVLTSDIRGIRQQAGEAAILVDPESIEAIAHGICLLWTDDELCRELIQKGKGRTNTFTLQDFRVRLAEIIEEAKSRITSKPAMNGSVPQVE
jgi:glycosyltransferase involved in cell wall biosynthesis